MSAIISKIRLVNFKRFRDFTIIPKNRMNVLVGDNEVGKSSILEAIDLVTSGSVRKVESIGIDKLLNVEAVQQFQSGERIFKNLPKLTIELYLSGNFDHTMNGKNNTSGIICDGIRLICAPNEDYRSEISESLNAQGDYFPYDYYSIRFSTFADEGYSGYKKKVKCVLIDSSSMNTEYANNDFIKRMYNQFTESNIKERALHRSKYRILKNSFSSDTLKELNERIPADKAYAFGLKVGSSLNLENDLMIYENGVGIDSKGTGKQVFVKTDFALERAGENVDIVLIEEPENHLSHTNLRKLIQIVADAQGGQIFVTTHSSLISTRLELNNLLILHHNSDGQPTYLNDLDDETTRFFQKAPVANIVEFALSSRVILVEGPAEYMLFEKFYKKITEHKPDIDNVHIMDVHGLSFKRYLEISKILHQKVAVVTDNDHDVKRNCKVKYAAFDTCENIQIFYECDETKNTFEKVLYADNKLLLDRVFGVDAERYMLSNKTDAAYALLSDDCDLTVPNYISEAIEWIKE